MRRARDKMMLVRCYRGKLSVWAALCVLVLCWFYVFPGDRLPAEKEIVEEVLRQGDAWHRNQTGIDLYRLVSRVRVQVTGLGEVRGKDGVGHGGVSTNMPSGWMTEVSHEVEKGEQHRVAQIVTT